MQTELFVVFVIFLGVFTQSLSGFGVALVTMALLPIMVDIQVVSPLVAVVALTIELFLLLRYRHALNLPAVWRLIVAALVGIPFGVWALRVLDEQVILKMLGFIIIGFAIYALLNFRLPELAHQAWAYIFGFTGGLFGGAYNISGPPVIVFGNCRRWERETFKSNLQGFFFVSSIFVVVVHALNHNLTMTVWELYLWSVPAMFLGILLGTYLDRFINPFLYRRIVLGLLVVLGLRLIL